MKIPAFGSFKSDLRKLEKHKVRSKRTPRKKTVRFVAIDGEALWRIQNLERIQEYCLLASSEEGSWIYQRTGLSTIQILDWLTEIGTNSKSSTVSTKFVGFALGYDVNCWFRDVSPETRDLIFAGVKNVQWKDYEIEYRAKRYIVIRKRCPNAPIDVRAFDQIKIYDAFSYFGTSFEKACESFLGEALPIVKWGKKFRSGFVHSQIEKVIEYCQAENQQLVLMMDKIKGWFDELGMEPREWYGPSAVAQYCLKKWGIESEQGLHHYRTLPNDLYEVFNFAYYGGRFEAFKIGHFNWLYSYDINSAYPDAMRFLPTLESPEKWRHLDAYSSSDAFAVYRVTWDCPEDTYIGPFPWRSRTGSILFPISGEGWYWKPEIDSAVRRFGRQCIQIHEGWSYPVTADSSIGARVSEIYRKRAELKASGNPAQYALKITANSLYGKLCQSIGTATFNCMPWAGFITSYTRAKLMEAVSGNEQNIVSFATDGILSLVPLPELSCGKALGEWDYQHYDLGGLVLMPGVYRLRASDTDKKVGHRGYQSRLPWVSIVKQLNATGKARIPVQVFITHRLARMQHLKRGKDWLKFVSDTKVVNPQQEVKRSFHFPRGYYDGTETESAGESRQKSKLELIDWRRDFVDSSIRTIPGSESKMTTAYEPKNQSGRNAEKPETLLDSAEVVLRFGEVFSFIMNN